MAKFAKSIGLTVILNLLIKPLGLWVDMEVQNAIGDTAYGTFASLFSLGFLLSALTDLGINQYLTKSLAEDPKQLGRLFPEVFSFKSLLTILYPFAMVGIGWLMGYESSSLYFLALLSLVHAFIQFNFFFRANFQGFQYFSLDAFASNVDKVLQVVILLSLLWHGMTLEKLVYGRLGAVALAFGMLFFMMIKKGLWHRPSLKFSKLGNIIKLSIPFALMTILYSVNEKVDQVMVERLSSAQEAGIYAASYRWLDALMMFLWTVLPMFFARFAHHESTLEKKNKLLKVGTVITALPLVFVCGMAFVQGDLFFFAFRNNSPVEIQAKVEVFQVLSFSLMCHGFFAILSTYLTSNGFTKQVNIILVLTIALNIVLNAFLIPQFGSMAAAYTTGLSTLLASISYMVLIVSKSPVNLPWMTYLKLLPSILLYFAGLYFLKDNMEWYFYVPISGILALGGVMLSRLIKIGDLKEI